MTEPVTDANPQEPPEWIAEILARWVPPPDYDARLSAVVDGYLADQVKKINPSNHPARPRPAKS
ncbi:hypothetical protein TPA0910_48760 [Streptomyces hygroscopicus subsp. sporocinereus]|uniref:Transposase n=1 Tax=Streptomyces hygroscopicus TaxID=1912 RepID=A0ABQ3U5H6_STRHY|nr:hypothetical protein TPA0910_48760 [Streptomyces hygroscopicus]